MSPVSTLRTFEDIDCAFPKTLPEALELMADEKTRGQPLAGGTDLMVQWESGFMPVPERAISVKSLPELREITETDNEVIVGGSVTHMELRESPAVCRAVPSLAEAAATIGGFQIQIMGTIAGSAANASPAGDLAPSLLITDGTVVLASVNGEREVKLTEFWSGYRQIDRRPDELIVRFRLPKLPEGHHESWRKLGARKAQAISKVMGSSRGYIKDGVVEEFKVALGSVAPTAVRFDDFEKWIAGKPINEEILNEAEHRAAESVSPIDDIRSTAKYRKWVSGRLIRSFLEELSARAG